MTDKPHHAQSTNFDVQGFDKQGNLVTIKVSASSAEDAHNAAAQQGLLVIESTQQKNHWLRSMLNKGQQKFPLILFNQELASLLEAGLSIVEALEALQKNEKNTATKSTINAILSSLREGNTLSTALSVQPGRFPELYIATIRASERTGNLLSSIRRYISYQLQVELIRKKVVAASIYPALLLSVGSLVVIFLMVYVVPKFSRIYADSGHELPFASWLLMKWGEVIEQHGWLILGGFVSFLLGALYLLSLPSVRAWFQELIWNSPILGERVKIYQLSRFYRTLSMLIGSGIPVITALDQVSGLLDQRLRSKLAAARNLVREGIQLSVAVERNGLSTPIADSLLRVGEQTGEIDQMMDKIADFHEEEINRWIDWASRLLEPVLMTFIGIVIGGIVVLMYIPIFELAGSIQ